MTGACISPHWRPLPSACLPLRYAELTVKGLARLPSHIEQGHTVVMALPVYSPRAAAGQCHVCHPACGRASRQPPSHSLSLAGNHALRWPVAPWATWAANHGGNTMQFLREQTNRSVALFFRHLKSTRQALSPTTFPSVFLHQCRRFFNMCRLTLQYGPFCTTERAVLQGHTARLAPRLGWRPCHGPPRWSAVTQPACHQGGSVAQ